MNQIVNLNLSQFVSKTQFDLNQKVVLVIQVPKNRQFDSKSFRHICFYFSSIKKSNSILGFESLNVKTFHVVSDLNFP